MTTTDLTGTIERMQILLQAGNIETLDSRAVSNLRKELFENFKLTSFANSQERQQYWNQLQLLLDTLKERQTALDKESEKFATEAEKLIDKVKDALGDGTDGAVLTKEAIESLKKQVSETAGFIRQSNWPNRERRTAAWDRFKSYRDALKEQEDHFYNQLREERAKLAEQSSALTQAILYAIRACHPEAATEKLYDITATIAALSDSGSNTSETIEPAETVNELHDNHSHTPLKTKSEGLRDLRKFVIENRDTITREDKQRIFAAIDEVQSDLDNAWAAHKEALQQKKNAWEERQKEREQKHTAWEQKQKDFLAKLEDRLNKQHGFREKLTVVYEKQNAFWERLEKRILHQQDYIRQLHEQLNELENKYAVTTDSKYREKLSEWIKGKYGKIEEIEADIKDMEAKIIDAKNNIADLPGRIAEVEKSIEEIQLKIAEVNQNLQKSFT